MCGRHVVHTPPVADMASLLHRKSTSTNSNGTRFEAAAETSTESYNHLNENKEAESNDAHGYLCIPGRYSDFPCLMAFFL